jgi:signal transduction histidine kinase
LLHNAAQALADHAGPRVVLVRSIRRGRWAILQVHDSGPGVAPRDRARIFDPYFTTKAEGTGLGLPIVKKVVLEHAGEIRCTKSELGGAEFSIELPLDA